MAWFHPELYRRVLTYSGTFVNQQSPDESGITARRVGISRAPDPGEPRRSRCASGWKWARTTTAPRRDEASLHNWVIANQRMAAALKAKGYHYRYVFAENAGHVDAAVVNQTLPEALLWLWNGYPIK